MEYIVKKDKNISAEVLSGDTDLFFTFQVPSRAKMNNIKFANYINEFDAWGFITWIFKKNGVLVDPYGAIQDQVAFGAPAIYLRKLDLLRHMKVKVMFLDRYFPTRLRKN